MSFKATVLIEKRKINILYCEYSFFREVNNQHFPITHPRSGYIIIRVEASGETFFEEWSLSNTAKKSGSIVFYKRDNQSKMKELIFSDAYCISLREIFHSTGTDPYVVEVKLSAGAIKFGSNAYYNPWFDTSFNGTQANDNEFTNAPVAYHLSEEPPEIESDSARQENILTESEGLDKQERNLSNDPIIFQNNPDLMDHILKGHKIERSDGSISGIKGVHHSSANSIHPGQTDFNQGDVRIKPGSRRPPDAGPDEIYEAEPEVYGLNKSTNPPAEEWRKKQGGGNKSTFYPDSWDESKIKSEIEHVRLKITAADFDHANGWYSATNSEGTFKIAMYVQDINDIQSKIGSAFPLM